jgi:hypothetical protein
MKPVFLILLMLLSFTTLKAQIPDDFDRYLMKTEKGFILIYNGKSQSITVNISSNDIDPMEESDVINIDKDPIQFNFIPNRMFSATDATTSRQKAELLAYSEYELKYLREEVKFKISNVHKEWVVINNKLFLLWYFNMPPDNKSVLQQVYLSTLCFAHAFNINSPITPGQKLPEKIQKLTAFAKTLKMNNFKIDLGTLARRLQAEK